MDQYRRCRRPNARQTEYLPRRVLDSAKASARAHIWLYRMGPLKGRNSILVKNNILQVRPDSTRLHSTQLNSIRLHSTPLNLIRLLWFGVHSLGRQAWLVTEQRVRWRMPTSGVTRERVRLFFSFCCGKRATLIRVLTCLPALPACLRDSKVWGARSACLESVHFLVSFW